MQCAPPPVSIEHATAAAAQAASTLAVASGVGPWPGSVTRPKAAMRTELREAIRAMCAVAHRDRTPVEQVLVRYKRAWGTVAETCGLPPGPDRDDFARQVITMCIEEYYAAPV